MIFQKNAEQKKWSLHIDTIIKIIEMLQTKKDKSNNNDSALFEAIEPSKAKTMQFSNHSSNSSQRSDNRDIIDLTD